MARAPRTSRTNTPAAPRSPAKPPRSAPVPQRHAESHDDDPLESLGKAVSAPVRDAADPQADEKPQD